jgi:transposase
MSKLYCGIDLHSNNSVVVLLDETDKVIYQKRLANDLSLILKELSRHYEEIVGIVVESTYNWYWLVDGLQAEGYKVHLANTTAIKQYSGLKYTDDKADAIWLAKLLRLGILEEGYIYPKEQRGLRELLRRRLLLVQQRTGCMLGIQAIVTRYENVKFTGSKLKACQQEEEQEKLLGHIQDKHVQTAVRLELKVLNCVMEQIAELERHIFSEMKGREDYQRLKAAPGIGPILSTTILLETGDIKRFASAGNYSSYCRCVDSKRISNAKKKGENNRKNGNVYLGWAFVEAANFAIRFYEPVKRYYQRKLAKTNRIVAIKTIANKLSKACFFMLRDGAVFDMQKLFG